jgi:hypothetical protein
MKTLFTTSLLILALTGLGATRTMAYDHDDRGWYDNDHHRHAFTHYHNHRGYWDQRDGARVFISL